MPLWRCITPLLLANLHCTPPAMMNVMVEDLDSTRPRQRRTFQFKNEALDLLLLDFLQELIYYKDSKSLMLRPESVCIQKQESQFVLEATARGEKLDSGRHRQGVDVKAVTLHRFSLEKTPQGWKAFVILDIWGKDSGPLAAGLKPLQTFPFDAEGAAQLDAFQFIPLHQLVDLLSRHSKMLGRLGHGQQTLRGHADFLPDNPFLSLFLHLLLLGEFPLGKPETLNLKKIHY
jgi:protein archease